MTTEASVVICPQISTATLRIPFVIPEGLVYRSAILTEAALVGGRSSLRRGLSVSFKADTTSFQYSSKARSTRRRPKFLHSFPTSLHDADFGLVSDKPGFNLRVYPFLRVCRSWNGVAISPTALRTVGPITVRAWPLFNYR